jgi:hypothetical protein
MEYFIINDIKYKYYIGNGIYAPNNFLEINFTYPKVGWLCREIFNRKIGWIKYDFLHGFHKDHPEAANYLDKIVKNIAFM